MPQQVMSQAPHSSPRLQAAAPCLCLHHPRSRSLHTWQARAVSDRLVLQACRSPAACRVTWRAGEAAPAHPPRCPGSKLMTYLTSAPPVGRVPEEGSTIRGPASCQIPITSTPPLTGRHLSGAAAHHPGSTVPHASSTAPPGGTTGRRPGGTVCRRAGSTVPGGTGARPRHQGTVARRTGRASGVVAAPRLLVGIALAITVTSLCYAHGALSPWVLRWRSCHEA